MEEVLLQEAVAGDDVGRQPEGYLVRTALSWLHPHPPPAPVHSWWWTLGGILHTGALDSGIDYKLLDGGIDYKLQDSEIDYKSIISKLYRWKNGSFSPYWVVSVIYHILINQDVLLLDP